MSRPGKPRAAAQAVDYYTTQMFDAVVGDTSVRVVSKAGLPHPDGVTAATRLLADAAVVSPQARIMVVGGGQGALAVALARRATAGWLDVLDIHSGALDMAQQTLNANAIQNAAVHRVPSVLPEAAGRYDVVCLEAPPNRSLARRWLVEAHRALRVGGMLYLAGANGEGIQSIIADAEALFGNVASLGFKAKNRVARATKNASSPAPAWATAPGIVPGTFAEVELDVGGQRQTWYSLPGVFAHDRLDPGTALLLEHLDITPGAGVLDAGCGLGILGIVAARRGAGHVDLIDVNLLAVAAAERNVDAMSISNAHVLASDALQAVANRRYDLIVSNPPFHSGKTTTLDVAHTFVAHGKQLLRAGGRIVLVANRFLAYDEVLRQYFRNVERAAQTPAYHVLIGQS